tara:strand:- start:1394 stop:1525 length:132 start_codon:yes stop_codon:yes gene_type:complete
VTFEGFLSPDADVPIVVIAIMEEQKPEFADPAMRQRVHFPNDD